MNVFIKKRLIPLSCLLFFFIPADISAMGAPSGPGIREKKTIFLEGKWEFRYARTDKNRQKKSTEKIPDGEWGSTKTLLNPPGRKGHDILWLRHPLDGPEEWGDISVFLPSFLMRGYEVYLGSQRIFSSAGVKNPDSAVIDINAFRWQIISLGNQWRGKTLYLKIYSNFKNIGIYKKVRLGTTEGHLHRIMSGDIFNIIVAAIFLLLSIVTMAIFIIRRDQRVFTGFALFAFCLSIYIGVHTDLIFILFTNIMPWPYLWLMSAFFLPVGLLIFVAYIGSSNRHKLPAIASMLSLLGMTALILTMAGVLDILSARLPLYLLYLVALPYVIYILITEAVRGNRDARILTGGIFAVIAAFVPAIIQALFGVMGEVEAPTCAGSTLLAAAMVMVLIRRLSTTYRDLEVYSKRLKKADRQKDEFLAHTSHELRTPLNGIMGLAETLINELEKDEQPRAQRYLSLIISSSRRLSNLVNDILDYSKLKNSTIRLQQAPLDMQALTDVVIEFMTPLIQHRDITIINNIPIDFPHAFADEERTHQILYNLIGNAIKFTDSGSIVISAQKFLLPGDSPAEARAGKEFLEFSITDTGTGISKDLQERIFLPYEQGDEALSKEYGGTGIGLFIVRHLVELHGGTIKAASNPDQGSIFRFTLPASVGTDKNSKNHSDIMMNTVEYQASSDTEAAPRLPDSGAHVLIVDDDPINLEVLSSILEKAGFSVTMALNGTNALDLIIEQEKYEDPPFDLILLDVMMPRMSGYELTSLVRHRYSMHDLPIIVVTARNTIPDLVAAFNAGANDYITKPINRKELIARAGNLVTLHRTVREHREARYKLLQERMSPHFLFNALNTIHALLLKDSASADKAVLKLAHNYRYILNHSFKKEVPFEEEWDFVINYLSLEELFYRDHLTVTTEKEGDFNDVMVPPLVIQPVVENALKHGAYNVNDHGVIYLRAERNGQEVIITVQDNGNGLSDDPQQGRSLSNITERLQYFYEDATLDIKENPHRGVTVTIRFSVKEKSSCEETQK